MVSSSDDERDDTGGIPRASVTRNESLEEYRRIRREQDEEYARSLQADQLKVVLLLCNAHFITIVCYTIKEKQKEDKKVCIVFMKLLVITL